MQGCRESWDTQGLSEEDQVCPQPRLRRHPPLGRVRLRSHVGRAGEGRGRPVSTRGPQSPLLLSERGDLCPASCVAPFPTNPLSVQTSPRPAGCNRTSVGLARKARICALAPPPANPVCARHCPPACVNSSNPRTNPKRLVAGWTATTSAVPSSCASL